jgi:hypothetical protein
MYGFNITVCLTGEKPGNLDEMLDVVTDQLTIMCDRETDFEDFMVTRHVSGDATFLIVVSAKEDEARAMTRAITWLHTALNAANFGTPGWLRRAEQIFAEESPEQSSGQPATTACLSHYRPRRPASLGQLAGRFARAGGSESGSAAPVKHAGSEPRLSAATAAALALAEALRGAAPVAPAAAAALAGGLRPDLQRGEVAGAAGERGDDEDCHYRARLSPSPKLSRPWLSRRVTPRCAPAGRGSRGSGMQCLPPNKPPDLSLPPEVLYRPPAFLVLLLNLAPSSFLLNSPMVFPFGEVIVRPVSFPTGRPGGITCPLTCEK